MKKSWFISIALTCAMLLCSTSFAADAGVGMVPEPAYDLAVFVDTGPSGLMPAVVVGNDGVPGDGISDKTAIACMAYEPGGESNPTDTAPCKQTDQRITYVACGDDNEPSKPMAVPWPV